MIFIWWIAEPWACDLAKYNKKLSAEKMGSTVLDRGIIYTFLFYIHEC